MKYVLNERQIEKLKLSEQDDSNFDETWLKRRSHIIEELIDEQIESIDDKSEFDDEFEFATAIIGWTVDELLEKPDFSNIDYYVLQDFLKDNFGDYILSEYTGD